jgi:hypothetical protein
MQESGLRASVCKQPRCCHHVFGQKHRVSKAAQERQRGIAGTSPAYPSKLLLLLWLGLARWLDHLKRYLLGLIVREPEFVRNRVFSQSDLLPLCSITVAFHFFGTRLRLLVSANEHIYHLAGENFLYKTYFIGAVYLTSHFLYQYRRSIWDRSYLNLYPNKDHEMPVAACG